MPIKHAAAITKRIPTMLEVVFNAHRRFFPKHWSSNDYNPNCCSTQVNYQLTPHLSAGVCVDHCQLRGGLCACEHDFFLNLCLEPTQAFIHGCVCQLRYGKVQRPRPDDGLNKPTSLWAEAETQCWQSCRLDGAGGRAVKCTAVIYTHRQG